MKKTIILSGCKIKVNLSKEEIKKLEEEERRKIITAWNTNNLD